MGAQVQQDTSSEHATMTSPASSKAKQPLDAGSRSTSMASSAMEEERHELKIQLKALLLKHHGSTKVPEVQEVLDELIQRNPSAGQQVHKMDHWFQGEFRSVTAPTFPGRLETADESLVQYTLGRMSFNIFQPHSLVCTLERIRNPLHALKSSGAKFSYDFLCDILIHTPSGEVLPATLRNCGSCSPSENKADRFRVQFTGGTLLPREETMRDAAKLALWQSTFANAYTTAHQQRSIFSRFFWYLLQLVLGLTLPEDTKAHTFHFEMKRAPVGHFDVLYLDEDMRITKGNRGTTVVVERMQPEE